MRLSELEFDSGKHTKQAIKISSRLWIWWYI